MKQLKEDLVTSLLMLYKMPVCGVLTTLLEGETALLLHLYNESGNITPSSISEKMNITRGRVTAIINSLKKRKYIKLKSSPKDRRMIYVYLTDTGFEYIQKKVLIADKYFDIYVEKLGIENVNSLIEIINLSVEAMSEVRLCEE